MNIIRIDKNNQVNGDGLRCVIGVSGCAHHCVNCHNPETGDPTLGHECSIEDYNTINDQLDSAEISGVTFTGGDPLFPSNREGIEQLCKYIKSTHPSKTIGMYTGYLYEEVKNLPLMKYVDILIDGPYIEKLNPGIGKLKWRGSSNQRIINVQEERKYGKTLEK